MVMLVFAGILSFIVSWMIFPAGSAGTDEFTITKSAEKTALDNIQTNVNNKTERCCFTIIFPSSQSYHFFDYF